MPTKEQLEIDNTALSYSLDDAKEEIKRLKDAIEIVKINVTKMRQTINDKDNEINHLKYGNEQLRKSLYEMGGRRI